MTTPTTDPVPSNSPLNLLFNAEKLDEAVNSSALAYLDRFGVSRKTLAGAIASIASINVRGAWVTATAYAAKDVVSNSGTWYIAVDAHTSGATFAGDLAAHWRVYQGVTASDLTDLASALLGAALMSFNQTLNYAAASAGNKLRDSVSPTDYPWTANKAGGADAVTALNTCYQWCKANGKKMKVLNGTYLLGSAPTTFELPRDDGTYSPSIGAGETTLAAESAVTMPVCLTWDGTVEVEGESEGGVVFQGSWDISTGAINTAQRIGVLMGSGKDAFTTQRVKKIRLQGLLIGYVVQGALTQSQIDISATQCGIVGLIQSADGASSWSLATSQCYSGVTVGGWWLHRNRAGSASNMPSSFGGSYGASDIFRATWFENVKFAVEWQQQPAFGSRADAIDQLFDTYFFKSANSAIYPTGRATVNADAAFSAGPGYPTYRGIAGRPLNLVSRGGRYGNNVRVKSGVSDGHSRPFLWMNAGSNLVMDGLLFENCGLVNPTGGTSGNTMGTDRADPYRVGAVPSLALDLAAEGGFGTFFLPYTAVNCAPGVPMYDAARRNSFAYAIQSSPVQEFLGGAKLGGNDAAHPTFKFERGTFTPSLKIGATTQSGVTVTRANYEKDADGRIHFELQLDKASLTMAGTGAVTIAGLPASFSRGGPAQVGYFSMITSASLMVHAFINGTVLELWKGPKRQTALSDADLTSGPLTLTASGEGWI